MQDNKPTIPSQDLHKLETLKMTQRISGRLADYYVSGQITGQVFDKAYDHLPRFIEAWSAAEMLTVDDLTEALISLTKTYLEDQA